MRCEFDLNEELRSSIRQIASPKPLIGGSRGNPDRFFSATSLLPISNLDFWERTIRFEMQLAVRKRSPKNLWASIELDEPWLNLCSSNGFVRERALRVISGGAPNAFLFTIMLRRLNDWVPEVRVAARKAVRIAVENSEAATIADALWRALPIFESWGRWQDEDKAAVFDLIGYRVLPTLLVQKVIHNTTGPATKVLNQLSRTSAVDRFLSRIANEATQPSARARAYKISLDGRATWVEGREWVWTDKRWCKGRYEPILGERKIGIHIDRLRLLRKATRDKSPVVRRVAGSALIASLADIGRDALPLANRLAEDPYPSVAERGRFALSRLQ